MINAKEKTECTWVVMRLRRFTANDLVDLHSVQHRGSKGLILAPVVESLPGLVDNGFRRRFGCAASVSRRLQLRCDPDHVFHLEHICVTVKATRSSCVPAKADLSCALLYDAITSCSAFCSVYFLGGVLFQRFLTSTKRTTCNQCISNTLIRS